MSLSRLIIRPSLLPLFLELLLPELLLRGLVGGVAGVLVVSGRPVVVVRVARLLWDGAGGEDLRCIFYLVKYRSNAAIDRFWGKSDISRA